MILAMNDSERLNVYVPEFPMVPKERILEDSTRLRRSQVDFMWDVFESMRVNDPVFYGFMMPAADVVREDTPEFLHGVATVISALEVLDIPPIASGGELKNITDQLQDFSNDPLDYAEENPYLMVKIAAMGVENMTSFNAFCKGAMLAYVMKKIKWNISHVT